jgi:hypothetical protein
MATDFGRDTSCTTSLKTGRFSSGVRLVAEAAFRRLTTPRGMLRGGEDEANYGLDLTEIVGTTSPKVTAASLPGRIKAELEKDQRIQSVDVKVAIATAGSLASFEIAIAAQTAEGPFSLVLLASSVTVELLGIKAEG